MKEYISENCQIIVIGFVRSGITGALDQIIIINIMMMILSMMILKIMIQVLKLIQIKIPELNK